LSFHRNMLLAVLKATFLTHNAQVQGKRLKNQVRHFHGQSNFNRVRNLVATLKLSFLERLLKVGSLIDQEGDDRQINMYH
jgi:hypothetical protein